MALDFPDTPADGQFFAGYTYNSAVGVWRAVDNASFTGLRDVNASGPPVGATVRYTGSMWEMFQDLTLRERLFLLPADSPYSFDIANYPYAKALYVRTQAGGGGGGFAGATNVTAGTSVGGAGGGGEYTETFIPLDDVLFKQMYYDNGFGLKNFPRFAFDITIGAGGAGGTSGAGVVGGDSIFLEVDAYTGADAADLPNSKDMLASAQGGRAGASGATPAATNRVIAGAAGGSDPTSGGGGDNPYYTFSVPGGRGEDVWTLGATTSSAVMSGSGGASYTSPAQRGIITSGNGNSATNSGYGGGGTGGANVTGQTVGRNGGAGGSGFVIVEIYG